jgi:TolB-like protein/DNA-binding winged helix-turn-helix (wHTH) protein/Tfp pilus assembly protein PilF
MIYRIGTRSIDPLAYEIRCEDDPVPVEPQVFDLIMMLIRNRDRVLTKDEIIALVWNGRIISDATLNSRISAARQALGDDGSAQKLIRTVHGRGFRFVGTVVEEDRPGPGAEQPTPSKGEKGGAPVAAIDRGPRYPADRPGLVVMPFDNLSGEADQYFVDGVVEEITSALSRVREFFVIARQSAFMYKGRFVDVRETGRQLGVRYVVEGTVRRGGDRLRISVQLVDAEMRTQLWSDRYEGATIDVFDFQDRIAAQVAGAIHPAVRSAEIALARSRPPSNIRAYDLVLQAYPKLWGHTAEDNAHAVSILKQGIATDPAYGRAHALLAWCLAQEVCFFWSTEPEQGRTRALNAVKNAADLIGDDPTAMTALGSALSLCCEQDRAATYIERALTLDPNNAWAWTRYGWIAIYRNDSKRANERFERALMLSPLDPFALPLGAGMASAAALTGDYGEAIRIVREVLNRNPRVTWPNRLLAAWLALAGDLDAAKQVIRELLAHQPNASIELYIACSPVKLNPYLSKMVQGLRLAGLPEK